MLFVVTYSSIRMPPLKATDKINGFTKKLSCDHLLSKQSPFISVNHSVIEEVRSEINIKAYTSGRGTMLKNLKEDLVSHYFLVQEISEHTVYSWVTNLVVIAVLNETNLLPNF